MQLIYLHACKIREVSQLRWNRSCELVELERPIIYFDGYCRPLELLSRKIGEPIKCNRCTYSSVRFVRFPSSGGIDPVSWLKLRSL
jgi:hypothetical protein